MISPTTSGARPREGSSQSRRRGRVMRARPIASICCSPPESVPASWPLRWRSTGKSAYAASTPSARRREKPAPRGRA